MVDDMQCALDEYFGCNHLTYIIYLGLSFVSKHFKPLFSCLFCFITVTTLSISADFNCNSLYPMLYFINMFHLLKKGLNIVLVFSSLFKVKTACEIKPYYVEWCKLKFHTNHYFVNINFVFLMYKTKIKNECYEYLASRIY